MLQALKFVKGSVARSSENLALTHLAIENGTVRGYNGVIAICSPIPFDITCKPKADSLIKAISNCSGTLSLALTKTGKLSISSGKFRAHVECIQIDTPHLLPEGIETNFDGELFLKALKVTSPFVGGNTHHPWSNGILCKDGSIFATNNVALIEYWTGAYFGKTVAIPDIAVKEMLKINEAPVSYQLGETSITFNYGPDRWIRTQLISTEWPDLAKILNKNCNPSEINQSLEEGLIAIKDFSERVVIFKSNLLATHSEDNEGATFEIESFDFPGKYQIESLLLALKVSKRVDWNLYPSPALFFGDNLRGAIVGLK